MFTENIYIIIHLQATLNELLKETSSVDDHRSEKCRHNRLSQENNDCVRYAEKPK